MMEDGKGERCTYPRGGGEPQQERRQPEALPPVGLCRWPGLFPPCGLRGAGPHRPLLAPEPCLLSVRAISMTVNQKTTQTHTRTQPELTSYCISALTLTCSNTACVLLIHEALLARLKKNRGGLLRICSEHSQQPVLSQQPLDDTHECEFCTIYRDMT